VGTKVMEPVSMKLYELEPEADRKPGGPGAERRLLTRIAARKTAALLGLQLTDKQVEQAGLVFHYGLGMSWGAVYTLLRRLTLLPPPVAGLVTGASLSLLIDEGLTPLLGTSRAQSCLSPGHPSARLCRAPGVWPECGRRRPWAQQQRERTLTMAS